MRVETLTLKDFKSYGEAEIDLAGVTLASVVGQNGAGKSTILEAVVFALTGGRGLRNLDSFVRRGAEECRVSLVFRMGAEVYRLTRTRSIRGSGKSTLELCRFDGGLWVAQSTQVKETEQLVSSLLSLDEDTLLLTSIVTQEDAGAFFRLAPAQRLEGLGRILQLDKVYGPLREAFKVVAEEAKAHLEVERGNIQRHEDSLETLAAKEAELEQAKQAAIDVYAFVEGAEAALEAAQEAARQAERDLVGLELARAKYTELTTRRNETAGRMKALREEAKKLDQRITFGDYLREQLEARPLIEVELQGLAEAKEADATSDAERQRLGEVVKAAEARIQEATEEYRQAAGREKQAQADYLVACEAEDNAGAALMDAQAKVREVADAEFPVCDRCGQTVEDEALQRTLLGLSEELLNAKNRAEQTTAHRGERKQLVDEAKAAVGAATERGQERRHELEEAHAALAALPAPTFDASRHAELEAKLRELAEIPAKLAELDALSERLEAVDAEVLTLHDPLEKLEEEIEQADAELAAAQHTDRLARDAKAAVELKQAVLDGERGRLSQAEKLVARLEGEVDTLAPCRGRLTEAQTRAKELEEELADAELLKKAFSKWGVPALIVGNVLRALEVEVNELLSLYEGSLQVRFESERETRDGARDSLEIMCFDGEGWRPLDTFSGGERYRFASAMRLGLAMLLSHRAGSRVETLLLDEPEGLDAEGRAHLVKILQRMSDHFGLVMVFSHYPDLQEAMPSQLRVARGEDGLSRVEVVS